LLISALLERPDQSKTILLIITGPAACQFRDSIHQSDYNLSRDRNRSAVVYNVNYKHALQKSTVEYDMPSVFDYFMALFII
jgi:hypothetical protein